MNNHKTCKSHGQAQVSPAQAARRSHLHKRVVGLTCTSESLVSPAQAQVSPAQAARRSHLHKQLVGLTCTSPGLTCTSSS
eukprot:1159768-Pelagomonas_calceolata.AAC.5